MVTSHLGDCRSLQTALPSGIRMAHPCPSPHANIICSERSSLTTRISVVALTPHLCSLWPLFAIYIFFITFWYVSLTSLFIACVFPLEGKLLEGGIFVRLFIVSRRAWHRRYTDNICGMNDRKKEAAQESQTYTHSAWSLKPTHTPPPLDHPIWPVLPLTKPWTWQMFLRQDLK